MKKFINEEQEGIPQFSNDSQVHRQIHTLQNASRDSAKLKQIIKSKERENARTMHFYKTQILVTEIEM
jgi:hypothetical protein